MYGHGQKNHLANRKDQYTKSQTPEMPKVSNISESPVISKTSENHSNLIDWGPINNRLLVEILDRIKNLAVSQDLRESSVKNENPNIISDNKFGFFSDSSSEDKEPLNILTISPEKEVLVDSSMNNHPIISNSPKPSLVRAETDLSTKLDNKDIKLVVDTNNLQPEKS
jgi:hypothetical protein